MQRFTGKTAVVTGAAGGIGAATALRLASEGATVILADIADAAGEAVVERIVAGGARAAYVHCDVSSPEDWERLRDRTHEIAGPADVVHNNAFIHLPGAAHELTGDAWDREISVNLKALYLAARTFLDDLRSTKGCFVATSSVHANFGLPGNPAYAAAKGGICALIRQLAVEYGPDVRFNSVLPGPILTDVWDGVSEEDQRMSARATALDRLGAADEVASAVAFLASADASYITGTDLLVDGGWSVKKESK
ncbi:SDR family NAD(P)-dependent oxidoreductase [Streptomyces venezuelae]|uniref:SDR family NAD(P)-dependent oxidoreductase n=1 Tax=Streptomyces venezuelae TaxID=54571 RepID=UPI00278C3FD2|nr:SDR family oxidoreductase [Streptomyces venezuelae]